MIWLGALAAGLLGFELFLRIYYGNAARGVYSDVPTLRPRPRPREDSGESISITTADGITLVGTRWAATEPGRRTIVFAPEAGASRLTATHYAAPLLTAGYEVVAFDLRNTGDSEAEPGYQPHHWPTDREVADLSAVFAGIDGPIGFIGVSKGGAAGAIAATRFPKVRAICLISSFDTHRVARTFGLKWAGIAVLPRWIDWLLPKWHVAQTIRIGGYWEALARGVRYPSLEAALRNLCDRSVFLISGSRDNYIPLELAKRLQTAAELTDERLWLVPKAKHNGARDVATEEYDERVAAFFEAALPENVGGVSVAVEAEVAHVPS